MKRNLGLGRLGWVWIVILGEAAFLGMELRPQGMAAQPVPVAVKASRPAEPQRVSLQPILEFQPFGAVPVVAEPTPPDAAEPPPNPPVQPRGLALQGVLLPGSGAARVLLSMDDAPAQSYGKGDRLPGGGTLVEIAADQIWIEIDGQKQALGFVAAPAVAKVQAPEADDGEYPAEPSDIEPALETPDEPVAKPGRKSKPLAQPDLRNLIPGLTDAAVQQP